MMLNLFTVCGSEITTDGFLCQPPKGKDKPGRAVTHNGPNGTIYFCEEKCKQEYLTAIDKEEWCSKHK